MKLRGNPAGALRAALPFAILLLQVLIALGFLSRSGGLRPRKTAETQSYLVAASVTGLEKALSSPRPHGYPLFLETVSPLRPRLGLVPAAQAVGFLSAAMLFWLAVWRYSGSPWLALAAATPLPWAPIMELASVVQPDLLAAAAALAAVSCLLLLEARPSSIPLWAALALAIFASYQLRPAYLFLIGLVPCAGVVTRWCRRRPESNGLLRWGGALALAATLPFLAFSTLRWATVGHFGLVSLGGRHLSAAAACFLGHDLVRELPEDRRWEARRILARRRGRGFKPLRIGRDTRRWFTEQYDENLWQVTLAVGRERLRAERRAAREAAAAGATPPRLDPRPDQVVINERLGTLSAEIIGRRPRLYAQWVGDALAFGSGQLAGQRWVVWPAALIAAGLPLAWLAGAVSRRAPQASRFDRRAACPVLIGLGFFAASLLLLSLVAYPSSRSFAGAILLLPSALCVALFELGRRIRASLPG